MAVALTITDRASDASDLTAYTFTNRAIGTADATRMVLVGITERGALAPDISSVTIGGNAAANLKTRKSTSGLDISAIYGLAVPTGTTATIVVNLSAAAQRLQIIVASLTGDYNATPLDTSEATAADGGVGVDLNHDLSLDVQNGGAAFGIAHGATTGTLAISFSGMTDDAEQTVEALRTMAATLAPVATESPRTISVTYDTDGASAVLAPTAVVVSFAPAGDVTAPVLSNPTAVATGETTASLGVDTDEGNGTLSWVVTASSTSPSGAQVAAGQDHTGAAAADNGSQAVSGTGTQNANATGLTAATTYWAHFVQDDTAANRSNVATSASFVTDSAVVPVTPIAADEGTGGGGRRRRGRRYPYPNVIDDGWDWEGPDARAEPQKPQERPPESVQPVPAPEPRPAPKRPAGLAEAVSEASRPAAPVAEPEEPKAAPEGDRVAALEAEVESLREKVARLEAARRDDEEEQRLLMMLLMDSED